MVLALEAAHVGELGTGLGVVLAKIAKTAVKSTKASLSGNTAVEAAVEATVKGGLSTVEATVNRGERLSGHKGDDAERQRDLHF